MHKKYTSIFRDIYHCWKLYPHSNSLHIFVSFMLGAKMVPRLRKVLRGLHSSTKDSLLLHILVLRSNAEVLTMV